MKTQDYDDEFKQEELAILKEQLKKVRKAKALCCYLDKYDIKYDVVIRHGEVLGCDESSKYYDRFSDYLSSDYSICKNLLLKEKKKDQRYFLIITDSSKKIDLKYLRELLESKKLEFASKEEVSEIIKTYPGNVSLFSMVYDKKKKVELIIDKDLLEKDELAFHPLYNGMSLFIKPKECFKFIDLIGREASVVDVLEQPKIEEIDKKYVLK